MVAVSLRWSQGPCSPQWKVVGATENLFVNKGASWELRAPGTQQPSPNSSPGPVAWGCVPRRTPGRPSPLKHLPEKARGLPQENFPFVPADPRPQALTSLLECLLRRACSCEPSSAPLRRTGTSYSPGVSFSRTWKSFPWNGLRRKDTAPMEVEVWPSRPVWSALTHPWWFCTWTPTSHTPLPTHSSSL